MTPSELAAAEAGESGLNICVLDGLDDALVGVGHRPGIDPVAIYDEDKIVGILMERDGMTYEEAWDFYCFNIQCLHTGGNTPIIMKSTDSLRRQYDG